MRVNGVNLTGVQLRASFIFAACASHAPTVWAVPAADSSDGANAGMKVPQHHGTGRRALAGR
jgi:hypothetical protein